MEKLDNEEMKGKSESNLECFFIELKLTWGRSANPTTRSRQFKLKIQRNSKFAQIKLKSSKFKEDPTVPSMKVGSTSRLVPDSIEFFLEEEEKLEDRSSAELLELVMGKVQKDKKREIKRRKKGEMKVGRNRR